MESSITGSALSAFRPVTHVMVVIEGNNELNNRLLIKVIPAIFILIHQNCTQKVMIYNNSSQQTTLAKGTKLVHCYDNFKEYFLEPPISVMSINPGRDPVGILCNKMKHLPPSELQQPQKLLTEYRDVFSKSKNWTN